MRGAAGEIQREKAAVLGRIAAVLESHLETLERLGCVMQVAAGAELAAAREELAQVRREAELWRWYLIVQREANGLTDLRPVLDAYPIPPLP